MRRVSSAGDVDYCPPSQGSGHAGGKCQNLSPANDGFRGWAPECPSPPNTSAETSAKTFSLQIDTFCEMGAPPTPRMLRRNFTNCRDFHRISTMRALYLQEARLGVEIARICWASRNGRETGRTIDTHPMPNVSRQKAPFTGIYGANSTQCEPLCVAWWRATVA